MSQQNLAKIAKIQSQYDNFDKYIQTQKINQPISSKFLTIECFKHPKNPVLQGCTDKDCQNFLQCQICIDENDQHQIAHRNQIVDLAEYLDFVANSVKNANSNNQSEPAKKIKLLMQNESLTVKYFESKMLLEQENFIKHADDMADAVLNKIVEIKKKVENFFTQQVHTYKNNLLYFKQQYLQLNPRDNYMRFSDTHSIKLELLSKTPYEAFFFINNLRKASGLQGKVMRELEYLHDRITEQHQSPPTFGKNLLKGQLDNLKNIISELDISVESKLVNLPQVKLENAAQNNGNLITYNRKTISLDTNELLEGKNFDLSVKKTIQTFHNNSVTAMVAISDDVIATASFDRTIKIWRVSDGHLLKTIQDQNSITSLCVMKFSNIKSLNPDSITDMDQINLSHQIRENPKHSLSSLGYLLVSAGFDRIVKVWDFDFQEQTNFSQTTVEQNYGDQEFYERWKNSNQSYIDYYKTPLYDLKAMQLNNNVTEQSMKNRSLVLPHILEQSNFVPNPTQMYNVPIPIKTLRGHSRWVTCICSLEDEHNIVTGDEGGEVIIWEIVPGSRQLFRLNFGENVVIKQIISIIPYQNFAVAGGETIKTWSLAYIENQQKFVKVLKRVDSDKYFNIKEQIYSMTRPKNFKNILVVGCAAGLIKYIDLLKNKMVTIRTDHDDFVGEIILIEKGRHYSQEQDFFHKNINFVIAGARKLGVYNGYGQQLQMSMPNNPEDFATNQQLSNRNMQILGVSSLQEMTEIKMVIASQFSSEFYNYSSSKISVLSLVSQLYNFPQNSNF